MKVLGYVRVSTDDQKNSIEVQTEKILQYCKLHELGSPELLVDNDTSGTKPLAQRPEGHRLLVKGVKCIVAIKLDRLFRNTVDGLQASMLWNKQKTVLCLVDQEGVSVNTASATGKFIFTTLLSTAEFERNLISERITQTLQHKKSKLEVYGPIPYGFDRNDEGILIENEKEMNVVLSIFSLRANKYSLQNITDTLIEANTPSKNGGEWYKSTISKILKNDIYERFREKDGRDHNQVG